MCLRSSTRKHSDEDKIHEILEISIISDSLVCALEQKKILSEKHLVDTHVPQVTRISAKMKPGI